MALVPALAHYLAPGSVRYDPSNQPKNKNSKTQYTKTQRRGKSPYQVCPIKIHS